MGPPVKLLVHNNRSSANKMAATQCFKASRHGENNLHKFNPSVRRGTKGNLSDFDSGIVKVVQELLIYKYFHTQPALQITEIDQKKRKYQRSKENKQANCI